MNEPVVRPRARAGQIREGAGRRRRIPPQDVEGQAVGQRRRVGRPARRNMHLMAEQPAAEEHPVPEVEVQPVVAPVVPRRVGRPRLNPQPIAEQPVAPPVAEVEVQAVVAPVVPRRVGRPRLNPQPIAEQPVAPPIAEVEVPPVVAPTVPRRGRPRLIPQPIADQPVAPPVAVVEVQPVVAPLIPRRGRPRLLPQPIPEQPVVEVQEEAVPVVPRPVGRPRRIPVPVTEEPPVDAAAPVNIRCGVCLFNAVNRIFLPCGHTFCSECIVRFTRNYPCPQCRTPFQTAIVFFLP